MTKLESVVSNNLTCDVCGVEFKPNSSLHYISRDREGVTLSLFSKATEPAMYDSFDCPYCGCQAYTKIRKRRYLGYGLWSVVEDGEDESAGIDIDLDDLNEY